MWKRREVGREAEREREVEREKEGKENRKERKKDISCLLLLPYYCSRNLFLSRKRKNQRTGDGDGK